MAQLRTEVLVVGDGPAGHAAALAAYEQGIEDIITVGNAPSEAVGAHGLYGLKPDRVISNSCGVDFLEPYRQHEELIEGFDISGLETNDPVALHEEVVPLLRHAAKRQRTLGRTAYLADTVGLVAPSGDAFVAETGTGYAIHANQLVIATGGKEVLLDEFRDRDASRTFTSKEVLTGNRAEELEKSLSADDRVAIIGGAHSAYSIASWLQDSYPEHSVEFIKRSATKPFFASKEEAERYRYEVSVRDAVDKETGKINRFGGIRGRARDAWIQQVTAGASSHLPRDRYYGKDIRDLHDISSDVTVIQAAGYTPQLPSLYGGGEFVTDTAGYRRIVPALGNRAVLALGIAGSIKHGTAVYYNQAKQYFSQLQAS